MLKKTNKFILKQLIQYAFKPQQCSLIRKECIIMFRTHYCYKSLQLHQLPCINENGTHTQKIIASQQFSLKTKSRGITIMGPCKELNHIIIFITKTVFPILSPQGILTIRRVNLYVKTSTFYKIDHLTSIRNFKCLNCIFKNFY